MNTTVLNSDSITPVTTELKPKAELYYDSYGMDPREDFSNSWNILTADNSFDGDVDGKTEAEELSLEAALAVPIYKFEHGLVMYQASPFSGPDAKWDSGEVGVALLSEKELEEFNGDKELALKSLQNEVEIYTQWCNGEVYGWSSDDDGVSGFYSTEDAVQDAEENGYYVSNPDEPCL